MLTQRLGSDTQKSGEFIDGFIAAVKANPKSCDEVWLSTDYGFPSLEKHAQSAKRLSQVAELLRNAGLRVSLQISNTIGHGQYMSARDCSGLVYDSSPVQKLVGADGTTADYAFCWSGEYFLNYGTSFIGEYVKAVKPHTVWIDDDLRASNHHPVRFGCFCEDCMKRFNKTYSSSFDRETLVKEINFGNGEWREKHVEFVRKSLHDFTYVISKAANNACPESFMGFQYCSHGSYDGYGYEHIFSAMKEASGKAPKSRPGGGTYNDYDPNGFIGKSNFISFQNSMLPEYVTEKRPEIENLPDVKFGKTISGTCFETSLYLACGNNAMSYAMLMNDYEDMDWHSSMLSEFSRHRPYWERLCEYSSLGGSRQGGLRLYFSKEMYKTKLKSTDVPFESWNSEPYPSGSEIAYCAVPVSYDNDIEPVYLISIGAARRFTADDIEFLASKPCICDGSSLELFCSMGCGHLFGAKAESCNVSKLGTSFTAHPVNKSFEDKKWSQAFFFATGQRICDLNGKTEPISVYTTKALDAVMSDPDSKYPYGIADAIITTEYGAKWAVFGQSPFNRIISSDRRKQLLNAAEFLKSGCLGAVLETPVKALVLPRIGSDGKTASVSVVNVTIGESGRLTLRINSPAGKSAFYMSQYEPFETPLVCTFNESEMTVHLPSIAPWSVGTVFLK